MSTEPKSIFATLGTGFFLVLMFPLAWKIPAGYNLIAVFGAFVAILLVLGVSIVRTPLGVFVTELNVMSLSRVQLGAWTAVVLSSYFTFVITRARLGIPDPLQVSFDWHLWALMGISTSSLVGSSLVTSIKKEKEPTSGAVERAESTIQDAAGVVKANMQGTLYANSRKSDARFTDLFQGDELVNTTHIDLAKVQMFFFTAVSLATYGFMVAKELRHPSDPSFSHLPGLPEGLIAVLGISHAGYLGNKSITHTPVQP